MENFINLDNISLEEVNGGVTKTDVFMGIAGCVCPPLGIFWAIKTTSDWIYEQDW